MKINLDRSIDLEFNDWSLAEAGKAIGQIKHRHAERADDILRATLTLLLFGQIEQQQPGTIRRLLSSSEDIAKALAGTKPGGD